MAGRNRNLIIDGQILQTAAWHRGMGKYLLQVLKELHIKSPADTIVTLLLNSNLGNQQQRLQSIKELFPNIQVLAVDLPLAGENQTAKQALAYKRQLSSFIDEQFPDADNTYMLTALFLFDFFAEFPDNCRRLVLFYDLTPLLLWGDLGGYFPPALYMPRFQRILEADHIFAISETTRQDLLATFGVDPGSVTNINGGFIKVADSSRRPTNFSIPSRFILFPTGDLPHKNNDVAVQGFQRYRESTEMDVRLLITSRFSDESKQRLLSQSTGLLFTDNVSDEELEWLYEHAEAVLFASKYEGLGLPVLDAVANEKPIIAARIPVFEEMSKTAFYYFEPTEAIALSVALARAEKDGLTAARRVTYARISRTYAWSNTVTALRRQLNSLPRERRLDPGWQQKPRLAVACLSPGIGDFQIGRLAEPLHASLRQIFEVDYYFDGNGVYFRDMERPTFLDYVDARVLDIGKLDLHSYRHYQAVLYLIDDTALPSRVAQRAIVLPGMAVVRKPLAEAGWQRLITANQRSVTSYTGGDYAACQRIVAWLQAGLNSENQRFNRIDVLLRGSGSSRSIIRQVKALTDHET